MPNLERTDLPDDPRVVPDRFRLPFSFDPVLLVGDLANLGAKWTPHYVPENYSGDWDVIPLRAPCGETHPVRMIYSDPTQKTFADTADLQRSPYFRDVLSSFQTTLFAARLMRLAAGSQIKEHTDVGLRFEEGLARVHIPILTKPDVEFYLNGSRVVLTAGSCWYLRLSDPHRVANRGKTDLVHLVVDLKVNGWLTKLFRSEVSALREG
jgi:mannose-6-phosphate isomerase-like protein (cupin superfamily)